MKKLLALIMLIMLFGLIIHAMAQQDPIRLMRYADVANGKIVFCYQGDLWLVEQIGGRAIRLTVHHGDETYPKFSPDGKWIAFTGNYFGGRNVFIMPVEGGQPKQLTYHPSGSTVEGWTPDSKYVLFNSRRTTHSWSYTELYKVDIDGKYPEKLQVNRGDDPSFSPDGTKMVYNHHPGFWWWWKRYRGTFNKDLWIYDFEWKTFEQLTKYEGNDSWPMWGQDNKIYFVSDRNIIANIFAYSLDNDEIQQITEHTEDGIQWPSMSPDGKFIVYENDGRLYLLNTESRAVDEVVVYAPSDDRFDLVEFTNPRNFIQESSISPSGKRIAVDARGEIFSIPAERGDVRNLSESANAREQRPRWSPNGKYIAYVSDINGEQEIYIVDQRGKDEPIKLTDNGKFKAGLKWSPDSKKLLYRTNNHYLYMLDVESKENTEIAYSKFSEIYNYNWSPDSKWISFALEEKNWNSNIFLYSLENGESRQFTKGTNDKYDPVFTLDGKNLLFISEPLPGRREMHSVSLIPEEKEPYQKEDDEEEVEEEKDEESDEEETEGEKESDKEDEHKEPEEGEKEEKPEEGEEEKSEEAEGEKKEESDKEKSEERDEKKDDEVVVEVNFENVMDRVRVVPIDKGSPSNIQVIKGNYYFRSGNTLYAFNVKKVKTEKVIDNAGAYMIAAKGKKILVRDGNKFQIIDAKPGGGDKKEVKLDRLNMKIDRLAEWNQIFHEGWRMIRDYFYDENHHGVDWEAVREHYAGLLPYIRTRDGLNTLMAEMVGELNASHQGVGGGDDPPSRKSYAVAMLGAELEPDYEAGYYRFKKIYKGDKAIGQYSSPLDAEYIKIKEGDYLLAINGQSIPATENYLKYLVNQHRNKLTLTTNSTPSIEESVEIIIKPKTSHSRLLYKEWIDKNTNLVDEQSEGKIGYVHLQGMGGGDLDHFRKYFEAYRYKEAIIIDVRYNGGGGIDPQLIDMLERKQYQIQKVRDSVPYERPSDIFGGKVVILCNEYSFSDAEVFPSAVKVRKLGTIIGKQTLGFVIAVSGYRLIDGGSISKTFVGLWEPDGTQLESRGAIPDIIVENTPEDEVKGKDNQLETAISYLMEEIEKSPRNYDYPTPIRKR